MLSKVKTEPAVVIGVLTAFVSEAGLLLADLGELVTQAPGWPAFVIAAFPAVAGFVVRVFVSPVSKG